MSNLVYNIYFCLERKTEITKDKTFKIAPDIGTANIILDKRIIIILKNLIIIVFR